MTETMITVVAAVAAVLITGVFMYFFGIRKWKGVAEARSREMNEFENRLIKAEVLRQEREKELAEVKTRAEQAKAELKEGYQKSLEEIKQNHKEALERQGEAYEKQSQALKAEMVARTEEILKQRQKELDDKAEATFNSITENLGKDLKSMKDAFEENKERSSRDSASMKENFENAVKQMAAQTQSIGAKADHLAEALRGQKKMQGCWGETILQNLLDAEGMVEGRDYDKEETLRDDLGIVIHNEETDKRMRPDYILHFVDGQDVIIDSKVSLAAFADYVEAETDDQREDAAKRNLAAIREQVKRLAAKSYSEYLKPERRMVDYVVMFVPNYPALQLAYEQDPKLWQWAYGQRVLIASAETLMPFLRSILLAWRNVEQVRNQQKIIDSAQNMIARVADFTSSMQLLGDKLADAQKAYEAADKKLRNSGQGILVSAHQVVKLGVSLPAKKALPEVTELSD